MYTNNNPLAHVQESKLGACQIQWLSELALFNFQICYHSGRSNRAANALSCSPTSSCIVSLTTLRSTGCKKNFAIVSRTYEIFSKVVLYVVADSSSHLPTNLTSCKKQSIMTQLPQFQLHSLIPPDTLEPKPDPISIWFSKIVFIFTLGG